MHTVRDIIAFISSFDEISVPISAKSDWLGTEIVGVNTDKDAKQGELAWISPKQVRSRPESLASYQGSLLICPKYIAPQGPPLVACTNPKLGFIRVVNSFFLDLARTTWPVPGAYPISPDAKIAEHVTLSAGVVIGSGVVIESGVVVGPNTVIANCTIKQGVWIGANCTIGLPGFGFEKDEAGRYWRFPHIGRVEIGDNAEIGSNSCIDRGSIGNTVIGSGAKIDNLVHIAHNVVIGPNSLVIANSMIGGSATIGENVLVAPSVSVMNQILIGKSAVLGMGAVVIKDVEEMAVMVGNPAKPQRKKAEE